MQLNGYLQNAMDAIFSWTINLLHFNVTFDSVDEQNKQQPKKKKRQLDQSIGIILRNQFEFSYWVVVYIGR